MRYQKPYLKLIALACVLLWDRSSRAMDPVVYSVYQGISLGEEGEKVRKDFYLNIGSTQGVEVGAKIEVIRKLASYDLIGKKLYKEISFPIATLRVIHVEQQVAIARLDSLLSEDVTPIQNPHAVMVGDYVRLK